MNFLKNIDIADFDVRAQTLADAERICEENSITVLELDVKTSFYFCCYGKHFIVLRKSLRGLKKLFELFHEIGHFYCHGGRNASARSFTEREEVTRNADNLRV